MFDQTFVHGVGHRLSMPCAKRAKDESRMSALRSWHRAPLIVVLAGLAVALLAWIVRTDTAINYLPRNGDADWIVFPTAVDARAHWYASLDATFRREFILPLRPETARLSLRALRRGAVAWGRQRRRGARVQSQRTSSALARFEYRSTERAHR